MLELLVLFGIIVIGCSVGVSLWVCYNFAAAIINRLDIMNKQFMSIKNEIENHKLATNQQTTEIRDLGNFYRRVNDNQ